MYGICKTCTVFAKCTIFLQVRLVEGMYPVFVADWLRVWPREQMFLMRYEDYGGHERERLTEVMAFLGLCKFVF